MKNVFAIINVLRIDLYVLRVDWPNRGSVFPLCLFVVVQIQARLDPIVVTKIYNVIETSLLLGFNY